MLPTYAGIIFIEGSAEQGIAREILRAIPDSGSILYEGAGIQPLAGILAQCRSFIGNDSGITHLAAALGIPCLVLFGPTLPQHWAPHGDNVIVLRKPCGCKGCKAGEPVHTCLETISVDRVIHHFQRLSVITV
jgi:ADP-heptose:LPS heptosyltransferase